MVEVAGIEPASEGLQLTEPTCVSGSLSFADASFEHGKCDTPLALLSFGCAPQSLDGNLAC